MPKTLVPPPGIVIAAGYKAHGLRHLHMENIKVIGASVHLGEMSAKGILYAQYPVLDLHA